MNFILFIAGLVGSVYFYSSIHEANQADDWSVVYTYLDVFETPSYERMINQTYREFKSFRVSYSYTYKDKRYTSNQLSLNSMGTLRGHQVDAIVKKNRWKVGQKIMIYVNPDNPSEATMLVGNKGIGKGIWIAFFFCLLLMVSGLVGSIRTLWNLFSDNEEFIEN
jgi:hypothetical protein